MNNVDANNPDAITACGIRGKERKEDMTCKEIAIQVISILTSNNVSILESERVLEKVWLLLREYSYSSDAFNRLNTKSESA